MERDVARLTDGEYDVVVIGGGIYGACVAWEAAARGLAVALLEKDDFASGTSANSLKTIHGGFRYLQSADLRRVRQSVGERRALSRIAPHLIHPLPVLVPTYGHGMKGREALALALLVNEGLSADRNRLDDPQKHIPRGRILSRQACLERLPGLHQEGLTGGAIFYDAQVYNSERLALAFLHSAVQAGAVVANYASVTGFLQRDGAVLGVRATDRQTGGAFEVRGRMVVNTAGPWAGQVLSALGPAFARRQEPSTRYLARAVNIVTRGLFQETAVGLIGRNGFRESESGGGSSLLFISPWRGKSLIGTTYQPYKGEPVNIRPRLSDVQGVLDEINRAYPAASLTLEDVTFAHAGLLPAQASGDGKAPRLENHYRITDHRKDGISGLVSVVGVKYTTARQVAQETVDQIYRQWGRTAPPSISSCTPLFGGRIERFADYLQSEMRERPCGLDEEAVRSLVLNYGTAYRDVLGCMPAHEGEADRGKALLRAQARYAVRHEMALTLADVVLRRTELGTAGHPGQDVLAVVAGTMAAELGWGQQRLEQEIETVNDAYEWAS